MFKKNFSFVLLLITIIFAGCQNDKDDNDKDITEKEIGKNVILFIGDGMQLEHEIAASRYLTGTDDGLEFHSFSYSTSVTTWDINTYNHYAGLKGADSYDPADFDALIGYDYTLGGAKPFPLEYLDTQYDYFITNGSATDSASAATAISTGLKTDAGNIAWKTGDPADGAIKTIGEELRDELGYSFGVVSTVQFSHATPAAFSSHNVNRNNYGEIGAEVASVVKPDVVIGAGCPAFQGNYNYIPEEDYNNLKASDEYVFVERESGTDGGERLKKASEQAISEDKKLFGLFGGSGGNFESPEPQNSPGDPQFVINTENPTLADCVDSTLNYLSKNEKGFFVMFEQGDIDWANHANDYDRMLGTVYDLNLAVKKAVEFVEKADDEITWENTVIIVTSDHSNSYMRLNETNILGKGELPTDANFSDYVTYSSTGHTNEPVMIYVEGFAKTNFADYEGVQNKGTSLIDNTDINKVIREVTGLDD